MSDEFYSPYSYEPSGEEPPQEPEQAPVYFDPAPSYQEPAYYYQAPPAPKKPKKKRPGLRIAALALTCALAGSVIGGAVTGYILSSRQAAPTTVVERTTPSTARPALAQVSNPEGLLTPAQVYQANVSAVVGIANEGTSYNVFGQPTQTASSGSGFIISSDGEILTNYHVVEGARTLTVTLYDGASYSARVLGYEAESDIALLKIDATDLPTVTLGDSDRLYVGDEVAAIGNPLGELTYSMTVGYISSMDRDVNTDGTPINMMQIDAAINPGNSGGPLFDMYGQVIGINTAKYSGSVSSGGATIEGIGFAIPINDVTFILDDLRENGSVPNRAYIGITVGTVAPSEAMGTPGGALVQSVTEGSSGDRAGLRAGDIITAVNGTPISDYNDLSKALKKLRAGDSAELTVFRGGKTAVLTVVFDAKPSEGFSEPTEEATEPSTAFDPWSFFDPFRFFD